ncbi:HU family DNA-binding protein [uncultured Campylobacter sp.]|uniref:HU family DNA-binding protein n=1 Tax=uncultured Campylobacter sp. TaxID=218934 RepID=UPI002609ACC2|nr:HU family DNA-binding protein [uncultured Campylobacter sp.]
MKKAEFVQVVAQKAGLSKKDTLSVIDATLEAITEALIEKKTVSFIGFGSFSTAKRAAREGKVPGTNRTYKSPATNVVKFKVGKQLKDAVAASKK